jgi:hypothetical protein
LSFHEGYRFGQSFGFQVSINPILGPHITTNQHELDLDNVDNFFNLIKYDEEFFLPLILKSFEVKKKMISNFMF